MPNEFEISEKCVIKLGTAGSPDTAVDVSVYFKTAKTSETMGNEDVTTFGTVIDAAKLYAYLLGDQQFDFDVLYKGGFWKTVGDIMRARKKPVLEIYPRGVVAGEEKMSCKVLVESRARNLGVNEVDKGTMTMKRSGPMSETVIA